MGASTDYHGGRRPQTEAEYEAQQWVIEAKEELRENGIENPDAIDAYFYMFWHGFKSESEKRFMIDCVRKRRERERVVGSEGVQSSSRRLCIPPSDSEEDGENDYESSKEEGKTGGRSGQNVSETDEVWARLYIAPEAEVDFKEFLKAHPGTVDLVLLK